MSNVTPIRPDTCQEHPVHSIARREGMMRAYLGRDLAELELVSVKDERDALKQHITNLESDLRAKQRTSDKQSRHALDTGRIQGMVACSCFVALVLAIASVWAI